MALSVPAGTHAHILDAMNRAHQQAHASGSVHNDKPNLNLQDVEDVLPGSSPTTLSTSVDTFNAAKGVHNRHLAEYSVSPVKYFAHKAQDSGNLIVLADLSAGSVYEDATRQSLITLVQELSVDREAHRTNTGGVWHSSLDTTTVLGTTATLSSFKDIAERLNLLKALDNAHYADVTAHGATTTAVSVANATEDSIDSMVALANDIRTKRGTHLASASAHTGSSGADTINTISAGAVAGLPADLAAFGADFKTKHNAHLGSGTYHNSADSSNTLGYGSLTTFAGFIAAAQEVFTDQPAHQRLAPISTAVRV